MVFATDVHVHEEFRERHGDMIERAVRGITLAHDNLDLFRKRTPNEPRSATLELLFHAAINAVLCATHHLVSGYPTSAGNMLRHYTEAVAMALLCLDRTSGVFEQFSSNMKDFPVHSAPTKLRQTKRRHALKELIAFDEQAWETVLSLNQVYDSLSHASALSLAHLQRFDTDNVMILGGEYDTAKDDAYAKDLGRCATAAESLAHLLSVVTATLYPAERAT